VKVQHVLIAFRDAVGFQGREVPEGAKTRDQEEAKRLAGNILQRAKGGEDFSALVRTYTDDSPPGIYRMANTGVPAGDPQIFQRDAMAKAFGDVSFGLAVGQIGMTSYDPNESPFGWHIIKRLE